MDTVNKLITAFVMLIIGIVLLGVIAQQTNTATSTKFYTGNQSFIPIPRWGGANNVLDNVSGRYYITTGPDGTIPDYNMGCGGIVVSSFLIYNGTTPESNLGTSLGISGGGNWTLNCSTIYGQTYIQFLNSTFMVGNIGNVTAINSVEYYPSGYLEQDWSRTILNLIPGFFAIALLAISLMLFYSVAKDYGIA